MRPAPTPSPVRQVVGHPRLLVWRPPLGALAGALLLFAASYVPSLLPRPWFLQGGVSAIAIALGYGLGAGLAAILAVLLRRRRPTPARGVTVAVLLAPLLALAVASVIIHHRWLLDVRRLMGMDRGAVPGYLAASVGLALGGGSLIVFAARVLRRGFRRLVTLLTRLMGRGWATVAVILATLGATVAVFDQVVLERLLPTLDQAYLAADQRFDPDVHPPDSPSRAGGPGSGIAWEEMGRQGRAFVTGGPSVADLEAFSGEPARDPVRIYAGLATGDEAEARAEVAVAELERTGAFDRAVLVLVAPTGTGWIDPYAVAPVEYLHNGDTAAVAVQYSYRPSWVLMLGNQDLAIEASRALLAAVRERLEQTPEGARPRLLLYGESLGSFGWESLFDGLDDVRREADGVLWAGPPRANPLWRELTFGRREGSPVWRPVYGEGEAVRFGSDGEALTQPGRPWVPPRVAYLQHASDPITWWSPEMLVERPEWMEEPRGPDVSAHMRFVPVVTFWQVTVDLVMGTNAPVGHGHKFGPTQAEAWALVVPPPGWGEADTERLVGTVEKLLG